MLVRIEAMLLASLFLIFMVGNAVDGAQVTVVRATCTEDGYQLLEETHTGNVVTIPDERARGHRFVAEGMDGLRRCVDCGLEYQHVPGAVDALPRIDFFGSMKGVSKVMQTPLEMHYTSAQKQFACWSSLKWDNPYSISRQKWTYDLSLYQDGHISNLLRVQFGSWGREGRYVIRGSNVDVTQVRDLLASQIWRDMVSTRPNAFPRLMNTAAGGTTDGFPVTVWNEGEPIGLFTLELCRDSELLGIRSKHRDVVISAMDRVTEESLFHAPATFNEWKPTWEVIHCGMGEYTDWAMRSFGQMMGFVLSAEGEQLVQGLPKHLDADALVDYLIFIYALGLEEHASGKLMMLRYEDSVWMPTALDMEYAFGLGRDGYGKSPESFLPVRLDDESWSSGTGSLLWDRILNAYWPQICQRYAELRQGVLSDEALTGRLETMFASIPVEAYAIDAAIYPAKPMNASEAQVQMLTYIQQRMPLLDRIFVE